MPWWHWAVGAVEFALAFYGTDRLTRRRKPKPKPKAKTVLDHYLHPFATKPTPVWRNDQRAAVSWDERGRPLWLKGGKIRDDWQGPIHPYEWGEVRYTPRQGS